MARDLALLGTFLGGCALTTEDLDADGFTVAAGDCDDLDPAVNPGTAEAAGDGVDQDCDGHEVLQLAVGARHGCALLDEGSIRCEGDNGHGQLDAPRGGYGWIDIAAGAYHTCALATDGLVSCWGDDAYGQSSPPPLRFVSIGAGDWYTFGVRDGGQAICWGNCGVFR